MNTYPIVGMTGFKGSGKDTVAKHLVKMYGFERYAFADKMKEAIAALLGIPLEKVDEWKEPTLDGLPRAEVIVSVMNNTEYAFEWREFLQRFGTEMGRGVFGQDFWVNLLISRPWYTPVVVSDVRLRNEAIALKELGAAIVRIERPGYESDGHESEQMLPADYVLNNDSDRMQLYVRIDHMMQELYNMQIVKEQ